MTLFAGGFLPTLRRRLEYEQYRPDVLMSLALALLVSYGLKDVLGRSAYKFVTS